MAGSDPRSDAPSAAESGAGATSPAEASRPPWVPVDLYPFQSRYAQLEGAQVHYVDEGNGPALLLLHGNPTWSFLYRGVIKRLTDRYRCIAVDYPGFGLSRAAPGYTFTPAEHARILEQLVLQLDLKDVTMMVQDWGGPIGFAVATRHPDRFSAFVLGNTWAWPKADPGTQVFSRVLGGPFGKYLITRRNFFIENILANNVKLRRLSEVEMNAYRGPFPTPESRLPMHVFPHEILASRPLLADIERGLPALSDRRALLVWPTRDIAFREGERTRWEEVFPKHRTVILEGAGHYIQEAAPEQIASAIGTWSDAAEQ